MRSRAEGNSPVPSPIEEDYLKEILRLSLELPGGRVPSGRIADRLNITVGRVPSILRTLAEKGLVEYKPYGGACLTKRGRRLGLRMVRRHRLLETFLAQTLGVPWDEIHAEAERMEHAVTNAIVDRIDDQLGFPMVDPHGDPIPDAEGGWRQPPDFGRQLSACSAGDRVVLMRVTDQRPRFLRFLSEATLPIGSQFRVVTCAATAGVMTLEVSGRQISLGTGAADHLLVESARSFDPPS